MTETQPRWTLISVARVHELHGAAIARHGGAQGVRDQGLVESAVENALNAAMYAIEGEVDPVIVAAYLLCYLARNHGFIDGNKRVAWMAAEDQLRLAKVRVAATTDEAEAIVLQVVTNHLGAEDVCDWMYDHLTGYYPEDPAPVSRTP